MEINKRTLAFTIEVSQDDKSWTFYIPAPSKARVNAAAPVLGYLFSMRQSNIIAPAVLAKDYELFAIEACDALAALSTDNEQSKNEKSAKLFTGFKSFVEDSLMSGTVISPDFKTLKIIEARKENKLTEETIEYAIGLYVFFYCIYRYAYQTINESSKKELISSLSIMEYLSSLQTLLSEEGISQPKATA